MVDNLNHREKMQGLFHILMELIFRPEWPSPIIVPFGMGESTLHEKRKMGIGSKSEFVSEKGLGPCLEDKARSVSLALF